MLVDYKVVVAILAIVAASACNAPAGKSHYVLAERLFNDHKYSAAVEEFQKIIEADPKGSLSQQAIFRIAVIQSLYLDSYAESIKSFKKFALLSQNDELIFQAEKSIGDIYFISIDGIVHNINEIEQRGIIQILFAASGFFFQVFTA